MKDSTASSPSWLGKYTRPIDSRISGLFGETDSTLCKAASQALLGGKRVRAVLSLLWCEAVSGDYKDATRIAVAYELAHAAALILDDIIDESETRRGERSIVSEYGLRTAILASNVLLARVPAEIAEYGTLDAGGETLKRLFELLGNSYEATIAGEFLDLELARRRDVQEKEYESMIRLKTGALIAASSASGALIGGSLRNDKVAEAAYDFGEWLGMAYQVQDDILDIEGDERILGKPAFSDIRSGKKNVVVIHTVEKCPSDDRRFLASLVRKRSLEESEIRRARSLFAAHHSIHYAQRVASGYAKQARKALESAGSPKARGKLLELLDYASARNY